MNGARTNRPSIESFSTGCSPATHEDPAVLERRQASAAFSADACGGVPTAARNDCTKARYVRNNSEGESDVNKNDKYGIGQAKQRGLQVEGRIYTKPCPIYSSTFSRTTQGGVTPLGKHGYSSHFVQHLTLQSAPTLRTSTRICNVYQYQVQVPDI